MMCAFAAQKQHAGKYVFCITDHTSIKLIIYLYLSCYDCHSSSVELRSALIQFVHLRVPLKTHAKIYKN